MLKRLTSEDIPSDGGMTTQRITYIPHPDITPEAELSALSAVYKFVLARKEAAPESRLDDAKERSESDSSADTSIPKSA